MEALYRLVQRKGQPLDFPSDHKFYGIKVLEYADRDYIGFIRTGFSKSAFFPCKLQTIALGVLGIVEKAKSGDNDYVRHRITILKKIDPEKMCCEYTYFEEKSFQSATFGARKNEIFKLDSEFYHVDIKERTSTFKKIPNLLVKHGRHKVLEAYLD